MFQINVHAGIILLLQLCESMGIPGKIFYFIAPRCFPVSAGIGHTSFLEAKAPPTALKSELSATPTFLSEN